MLVYFPHKLIYLFNDVSMRQSGPAVLHSTIIRWGHVKYMHSLHCSELSDVLQCRHHNLLTLSPTEGSEFMVCVL